MVSVSMVRLELESAAGFLGWAGFLGSFTATFAGFDDAPFPLLKGVVKSLRPKCPDI